MGLVYQSIDSHLIEEELRRRGYGMDSCRGFQFRLTVPGEKRKTDGRARQVPIGGITVRDYLNVRKASADFMQAADRVEAICKGHSAGSADLNAPGEPQINYDVISRMVKNNVDSSTSDLRTQLSKLTELMTALLTSDDPKPEPAKVEKKVEPKPAVAAEPPVKRKRGRPRKYPLPEPAPVVAAGEPDGMDGQWASAGQPTKIE